MSLAETNRRYWKNAWLVREQVSSRLGVPMDRIMLIVEGLDEVGVLLECNPRDIPACSGVRASECTNIVAGVVDGVLRDIGLNMRVVEARLRKGNLIQLSLRKEEREK